VNAANLPIPLPVLGLLLLAFVGLALLMARSLEQQEKVRARLIRVANPGAAPQESVARAGGNSALDIIAKLGSAMTRSGLLPAATRAEFEQTLAQAGWRGNRGLGLFVGAKILLAIGLPVFVYAGLSGGSSMQGMSFYTLIGVAFAVGLLAPDFVLKQLRKRHLKECERGLPDALDMMVICAQAGLALENAIERVAIEFAYANKAVSQELAICASEMRIGGDRRTALLGLGERTGLESMRRFAATLIQTMQFGTPLTHALRVLATEMRTDNLTKFEEKAAKLPVYLTFPMILFILPCVFLVVGGPAAIRIMGMFSKTVK
jgi:tight adherence protein C